jgi:hypothetical protein
MRNIASDPELSALLAKYDASGGVLDYAFLNLRDEGPPEQTHRAAALAGIAEIDRRYEQWAAKHASKEYPIEEFFRLRWDESKLKGMQVTLEEFWGTDDVEPKPTGNHGWVIPNVDGYKTAFFHPPYSLRGLTDEHVELFARINRYVLGDNPAEAEIFSWSTDWTNYFDAGHEWWGAFLWTIRPAGSPHLVVVGASSTD